MLRDEMLRRRVRGEIALGRQTQLSEDVEKRLRESLREINKKWPDVKPLNPKGFALSGLLRDGYLIYSQLSVDAAHPTVTSLCRHVGHGKKDGAV